MEVPPFLQHPPRYVPLPHNPLPPPNLPEDRNFFPQHHHLPPPPPLPFPPPPPSYRPLPPPPSPPPYNPHLSQFPFPNHHRPIEDDLRRRNRLDFPHRSPPRVFDRSPIDDDLRHLRIPKFDNPFSDSFPDSWADPPRISPENRLPLSFDREPHHDHSPFSNRIHESSFRTSDNHRHDIEGSFRFRDDYAEGFRANHNEELLRGRTDSRSSDLNENYCHGHDRYGLNSSISSRSFEYRDSHVSNINPSRDIGSNSRNYQSFHGLVSNNDRNWNNRDENWRRNHARSSSGRLSDAPEESENNDYGNADGLPVSSRRVPRVYDSSGKFNYRGNRSNREFLHSPRKKIEKKSVLDRIQFRPSYKRKRNNEQHFSSVHSDDSGLGNFRSRGSFVHPDDRMEEDREGSPVDLDVSFKSNALVAKAIVASSSYGVESNRNVSSSNWKNRKLTGADIDLVNSALSKLSDGPMEPKSSTYALECPTSSHVDSKKLGEHVKDSGAGAVSVISSEPCPRGTDDLPGSNTAKEPVSDTGGNTVGSDGTSSHRIRKKKKVISPISHVSNSQATKKDVDPVQADRSTKSPLTASQAREDDMRLKEKAASASMIPAHNVDMQPSPNEVTAVFENSEVNKSPWGAVAENGGIYIGSTHVSCLSSPLKINVDEGMVVADRSVDLHTILNSDKGPSELQNGSTAGVCLVGGLSLHSCQNDPPVLLQNGLVNGFSEAMFSVRYNANTDLSSSEEIRIHGDLMNLYSRVPDMHNASSSDNGGIRGKLKTTVADIDVVGCSSDFNEATVLPESFEADGFPTDVVSVEGNAIVSFSSAEETDIHASVFDTYRCNHYTTSTSGPHSVLSDSQFSEIGFLDENKMESFPDGATVLLGNIPVEGPPEARVAVGGNLHVDFGKDCSPNKRKDRDIHSDLVSPSSIGMPDNAIRIVHPEATTLRCPFKDLSFVEEDVLGAGNFGAGSQPSGDKDSIVQGYSLTKGSFGDELSVKESVIDQNGLSPKYIKKRKVWAPVSPSPMLSETQEEFVTASISTFRVELASNTDEGLMQSEDRVAACNSGAVCSSSSPPCSESNPALCGSLDAGACEDIGLVNEGISGNVSEEKDALVMTGMNTHIDIFGPERGSNVETVAAAKSAEEPGMLHIETVQQRNPLEIQSPDTDQWQPFTNMECESDLLLKDGLPSVSDTLPLSEDGSGVSTTNLHNEMAEPDPDTVPIATGLEMFNSKMSLGQILNEKGCEDVRKQDEKHMFEGFSSSYSSNASLKNTSIKKKPGYAVRSASSVKAEVMPQDARNATRSLNTMSGVMNMKKNQPTSAVPRAFPGNLSTKKTASPSHIATSRTWHRPGNAYASSHMGKNSYPNPATKIGKDQTTSYIRKGNSLVRKPYPVTAPPNVSNALSSSIYQLNSMGIEEMKKKTGVKSGLDLPSCSRTGLDATLERPKTPPLPCSTKLSNCSTFSSRNGASSPLADPPANGCSEAESDPLQHNDMDVPKPSEDAPSSSGAHENQIGQINNCESQSVREDTNPVSTKSRKMVYVKRKSNQLVAASSSSGLSRQHADKTEAVTSDSYYKRRKNQIIRKLSEVTENIALRDDSLNSEGKRAPPVTTNSFSRRRSDKGAAKTYKPSKFSLVWTLRDAQALKKDNPLIYPVWPHLFPWKRTLHWRSLMHTSVSIFGNRSLSTISRKLLLSRKRETIYTRSTRGFSLRKSKVLSVGGSSLKWSKSIERNSKKANEEATLAVAAAEKKKREQNGASAVTAGTKNRNRSSRKSVHSIELRPGERIFRIGSVRYKMDPTRRTLQRISDEELPNSVASQSGKDVRKTSVPKRLLIGNDEYVRIGNGNQLIRDPKKRTRLLASEKVRWSLHTARLRLAKRRKYCQFFTRFGKCNKDYGKCPYIHDPSKIAVCTKFLKGSCSDPNCKLTHKVIPERMQDCSYFLQGLCTNESCPYRHVNVNPNASVCEGFLRGYCADGNECRKKHSYVCPVFEETGICSRGSKCKLHHPKNRDKGKKKKPSGVQKNGRGRYFGSNISECKTAVSEKQSAKGDSDIFYQGRFSDYIHLDVSDEESVEINDLASGRLISWNGDPTDVVLDDDELIKSINLMKRIMMKESPNPVDSPE